jgi:hypothetical protein
MDWHTPQYASIYLSWGNCWTHLDDNRSFAHSIHLLDHRQTEVATWQQ